MKLRRKLSTGRDILHDYGWRIFLFRVLPWLLQKRYFVYAGSFCEAVEEPSSANTAFRLKDVRKEDIGQVVKIRPMWYDQKILSARLDQGHQCLLGLNEERAVHVRWLFTRPVYLPYLAKTIDLKPGDVYSDESFTLPEFRQRGFAECAIRLERRLCAAAGFQRFIALAATWNQAAIRSLEANGLKRVGECGLRFGFFKRRFYAAGSVQETGRDAFCLREE